jgi:hypothetical protein
MHAHQRIKECKIPYYLKVELISPMTRLTQFISSIFQTLKTKVTHMHIVGSFFFFFFFKCPYKRWESNSN